MGAQTVDFWMNHTPESLTFLFGGKVFTRNKDGAMEYVEECISTLPEEQKKEMMNIMEEIWENVVGSDKSLGCVLIDRDSMEYETVTYWGETPPRVEEIRPYRNGTLDSFSAMEESRYERDIPVSGLRFVKVPSIFELEKYRSEHPIDPKQRIGYFEESELEYTYEDIFSDEAFEDNTAPKNNRDSAGSDDFGEI